MFGDNNKSLKTRLEYIKVGLMFTLQLGLGKKQPKIILLLSLHSNTIFLSGEATLASLSVAPPHYH
jgi:hypothetical protein